MFVELAIQVKESEFSEEIGTTRGFVDVSRIESFYEDQDGGVYISTKSGDEFKVSNDIEYVMEAVNARN